MAGEIRSDLHDIRRLHTLKRQQELHIWALVLRRQERTVMTFA